MDYAKEYKEQIIKAENIAGINATIGLVVVNELQEILNTLKRIEKAWVPAPSVDVVGHSGLSQEVQSPNTIKANKARKPSKTV
jgi:hypothetical protein